MSLLRTVIALLVVLVVFAAAMTFLAAGIRHTHNSGSIAAQGARLTVAAAMRQHLGAKHLSYQWVTCVQLRRVYKGRRLSRCNVNFGDPHIEPYCAVLIDGTLLTDHEVQAIDCGARTRRDELAHASG